MRVYSFNEMFGNFGTLSMLRSSIRNKSVPNFILMAGDSGTGKSSSAEILSLAMTCSNRVDENPCLQCDDCKRGVLSLQGKGTSSRIKKVNLGLDNSKEDIDKLISQVFRLEISGGNAFFILEEVHTLDEARQTSLLEEIDRLDDNVYVVLCTSRPRKLLEELKNRAITFNFSNLKSSDSKMLLDRILTKKGYALTNETKDLILKKARGVPRTLVNLVDFISKNSASYDSIAEFLGEINTKVFSNLFRSSPDVGSYYSNLTELCNDYSMSDSIYFMKRYLLDLNFLSAGVSTLHSHTSQNDKKMANLLGRVCISKMQNLIHALPKNCDEPDFVFCMLKVRSLISARYKELSEETPSEGIADSQVFSSSSAIENHKNSEEKRKAVMQADSESMTTLNADRLKEMLRR